MLKHVGLAALFTVAALALPASADPPGRNRGTPAPVAGASLSILLVTGGYALVRRYRNRSKAEQSSVTHTSEIVG
jgi:hypothetical protein